MENLIIGSAVIEYDAAGKVTTAYFEPSIKIDLAEALGGRFTELAAPTPEELKGNADIVLGAWFSKMNEVELADRDRYTIESEIVECEQYPNGTVKRCILRYTFKERLEMLN